MNNLVETQIKEYIKNKKIKDRLILSESFGMKCEKISLENNETFVAKYYQEKNIFFNSIVSEVNSLKYLIQKFPALFPEV